MNTSTNISISALPAMVESPTILKSTQTTKLAKMTPKVRPSN